MIVLDASLAVKLVVVEPDSGQADRLYLNVAGDAVAPDLIALEVAQAIVRNVNARHIAKVAGQRALGAWREILDGGGIALVRTDPAQMEMAAELAMRLGHPVKDCLYLILAMEMHCPLVTCDVKFRDKALAAYPEIKLLADFT